MANINQHNIEVEQGENVPPVQNEPRFTLTYLASLVHTTFSGNRSELHDFLADCNNAFELAQPDQHRALLLAVLAKIRSPAKANLAPYSFLSWNELKEKLKLLYQDKKHLVQLNEELNACKQAPGESISQFYNRIELIVSRVISATSQNCVERTLLPGMIASIKDNALNRFVHHSVPHISSFLRGRDFNTLNDAFTIALGEERAANVHKTNRPSFTSKYCRKCRKEGHFTGDCRNSNNQNYTNNKYCSICKNNSHNTVDCFKKSQIRVLSNNSNINMAKTKKSCRYCKKFGHELEECHKLKFVQEKKKGLRKYCRHCKSDTHNEDECNRNNPSNGKNGFNNKKSSLNYLRCPPVDTGTEDNGTSIHMVSFS